MQVYWYFSNLNDIYEYCNVSAYCEAIVLEKYHVNILSNNLHFSQNENYYCQNMKILSPL